MKRISTILAFTKSDFARKPVAAGFRNVFWFGTVFLTALFLTAAVALCQEKKVPIKGQAKEPTKTERAKPSRETVFARQEPLGPEVDPKRTPKIVKMFPANNAADVDPNISQVWLTFDMPMGGGRAWAQRSNKTALDFDEDKSVFWTEDGLTCVAPVTLKRNKKYEILLNFKPFIGFASVNGVPSEALFYTFETGFEPIDPKKREKLAQKNFAEPDMTSGKSQRPWGPEQATGKPDSYRYNKGGDYPSAWASLTEDGQKEWLELTWNEPIEAIGIRIYETYNPGALVRITGYDDSGTETVLWEGKDPTSEDAPKGKGISSILFKDDVLTKRIRLDFDSPSVSGWNEIDAVGLVDTTGKHHWATGATASSTYADRER